MSQRNDEGNAMALGVASVAAGVIMLALALFAVLAFVALIFTVLCLLAWDSPLKLGKFTIEPEEAHLFIYRGIAGAVVVPVFIAFSQLLLNLDINWEFWPYFVIVGYVGGSLVIEIIMSASEGETEVEEDVAQPSPPPAYKLPEQYKMVSYVSDADSNRFRFASWDDEEEQR